VLPRSLSPQSSLLGNARCLREIATFHPDHFCNKSDGLRSCLSSRLARVAGRGDHEPPVVRRARRRGCPRREKRSRRGDHPHRLDDVRAGRRFFGRGIDYLSFGLNALLLIRKQKNSLIVAMTDPPLTSVVAAMSGRPFVNWIQDLFPDVAEAPRCPPRPRWLHRLRDWSLRRARAGTSSSASRLAARVPHADRAAQTGADAELHPVEVPHEKFVVGYFRQPRGARA